MKDYVLVDPCIEDYDRRQKGYECLAKVAIKYGPGGDEYVNFNLERIKEFWEHGDPYPSPNIYARSPKLKWFIHNKIQFEQGLWNNDFLHGLLSNGIIKWRKREFPKFIWYNIDSLADILASSPFGGKISEPSLYRRSYEWQTVPAILLKHSTTTISFMAGVLASSFLVQDPHKTRYAEITEYALPYYEEWGIPIEARAKKSQRGIKTYLISPFWVALFKYYMPESCWGYWDRLRKSHNASLYATILWRLYSGNDYKVDGLPYLPCRRKIFYDYKSEEGATSKIEMLRVEKGLTQLDNRIREAVLKYMEMEKKNEGN